MTGIQRNRVSVDYSNDIHPKVLVLDHHRIHIDNQMLKKLKDTANKYCATLVLRVRLNRTKNIVIDIITNGSIII